MKLIAVPSHQHKVSNYRLCMRFPDCEVPFLAQCTSLHPRLALLTGTVEQALDDLWHTGLLTVCMDAL